MKGLCELKAGFRGTGSLAWPPTALLAPDPWLPSPVARSFRSGAFSQWQDDFSFTINGVEIHSYRERSFVSSLPIFLIPSQRQSQFGAKVS